MVSKQITLDKIPHYSVKDKAYQSQDPKLNPFISNWPNTDNLILAARERTKDFSEHKRKLLINVLEEQNGSNPQTSVQQNIELLSKANTVTIITAHQPSLLTGPLYYIFKILSAINLTEHLNQQVGDLHFVPLFISGGEDHDFEEINHCNLFGKRINWEHEAGGAVGRMDTSGIEKVVSELDSILGENNRIKDLTSVLSNGLENFKTYADFQRKLVNLIFGKYGLIQLNMDNRSLKESFSDIMKEELLEQSSYSLVKDSQAQLQKIGFDPQAYVRPINLFYHLKNNRVRIEKNLDTFHLVGTKKEFSKEQMLDLLAEGAYDFSPNVVLRPLFQEFCIPNVAYIGGGGELAYWLERKSQFKHYNLAFPILIRRNSALIVDKRDAKTIAEMNLDYSDIFDDENAVINRYITNLDQETLSFKDQIKETEDSFKALAEKAEKIDASLVASLNAAAAKQVKIIEQFESRLKRSLKQKEEIKVKRISKMHQALFPSNGLQERNKNIFEFLGKYGLDFIDVIKSQLPILKNELTLMIVEPDDFLA